MERFVNVKSNPCCCINLKAGSIFVATAEIISNVILACLLTIALTELALAHNHLNEEQMMELSYSLIAYHPEIGPEEGETPEPYYIFKILYIIMSLMLAKEVAEVIFAFILILAIQQERLPYLKAWLIFKAMSVALGIIISISNVCLGHSYAISSYLANFLFDLISIYFFYVILRFYKELDLRKKNIQRVKPRMSVHQNQEEDTNI